LRGPTGPPAATAPVKVLGPLSVAIDPTTNTGATTFHIKNVSGAKLAPSILHVGDLKSVVTGRGLGAQVLLAKPEEATGKAAFALGGTDAGEIVSIKLLVSGAWEAGTSQAPLFLDDVKLADVSASKNRTPFNIRLESVATEDSPLRFEQGVEQLLLLTNDDAMDYRYAWKIAAANVLVEGGNKQSAILAASSTTGLRTKLPDELFPGALAGLFRDGREQAQLEIRAISEDGGDPAALPARTFPVTCVWQGGPDGRRRCSAASLYS
jgi:hypothetical protein